MNAKIDVVRSELKSLRSEFAAMRWMIGVLIALVVGGLLYSGPEGFPVERSGDATSNMPVAEVLEQSPGIASGAVPEKAAEPAGTPADAAPSTDVPMRHDGPQSSPSRSAFGTVNSGLGPSLGIGRCALQPCRSRWLLRGSITRAEWNASSARISSGSPTRALPGVNSDILSRGRRRRVALRPTSIRA